MIVIDDLYTALFSTEVTYLSSALKICISFLLGAIIGIERQTRRQSAGMRTISLICMASTSAMLLSIWIPQTYSGMYVGDPGRLAAQVLTGVGFIGAGAIIQSRGSVKGLTTAATIWVVAIIGLCVGAGLYIPAVALTFLSLFVLVALERYEKKKMIAGDIKIMKLTYDINDPDIDQILAMIKKSSIYVFDISIENRYKLNQFVLILKIQVPPRETLNSLFAEIKKIEHISSISLTAL